MRSVYVIHVSCCKTCLFLLLVARVFRSQGLDGRARGQVMEIWPPRCARCARRKKPFERTSATCSCMSSSHVGTLRGQGCMCFLNVVTCGEDLNSMQLEIFRVYGGRNIHLLVYHRYQFGDVCRQSGRHPHPNHMAFSTFETES